MGLYWAMSLRFMSTVLAVSLVSCAHVATTSYDYKGGVGKLGDTEFSASLIPQEETGGLAVSAMIYGYVSVKKKGPYQLRIDAMDPGNSARGLRFTRIELRTGKRHEELSPDFLGKVKFHGGRASWKFAGEVYLHPGKEDDAMVVADVEVLRDGGARRGRVSMPLRMVKSKKTEFHSLPGELMSAARGEEAEGE